MDKVYKTCEKKIQIGRLSCNKTLAEDIQKIIDCHFERSEKSLLEMNGEISLRAKHPSDFAHRNDTL